MTNRNSPSTATDRPRQRQTKGQRSPHDHGQIVRRRQGARRDRRETELSCSRVAARSAARGEAAEVLCSREDGGQHSPATSEA